MKTTVSGTDDPGQRRVSQTATSSEAKLDVCPFTTPNQHITYTTAQLHESSNEKNIIGLTIGIIFEYINKSTPHSKPPMILNLFFQTQDQSG